MLWLVCLSSFASSASASCDQSNCEIQLGLYGPITSISTTFYATAVAFDIDFRKNFNSSLVARFGLPIVTIPNLNPNLRVRLQIGTSNSVGDTGVSTCLSMLLGRNGMTEIAGLVGGSHSAISMPVASLAGSLNVPQISFGSTSPKLSNKAEFPYFLRTIPPDSIQGAGMWQFVVHFGIPALSFVYSLDAYGEGLFQTVSNLAAAASQAFRVSGVQVKYMPGNYDIQEAHKSIAIAKSAGNKFIFLAMTTDQATPFGKAAEDEGLFGHDWQLVGSEAVKIGAGVIRPTVDSFPAGFIRFNPISQGPLFEKFKPLWLNMTSEDVMGPEAIARFSIDKFEVPITDGAAAPPTDAMFASMDAYHSEAPFLFDAAYSFVFAMNEMMNDGVDPSEIKGKALLDKIYSVDFEGITGRISFNADGDRLASYTIDNLQPAPGRRLSAVPLQLVTVASFISATSTITPKPDQTMLWMDGSSQWTLPNSLVSCLPGYEEETATNLCRACQAGSISLGGASVKCTQCGAGSAANAATAATKCELCAPGTFSEFPGSAVCATCPEGRFSDDSGVSSCATCSIGTFANFSGATGCTSCISIVTGATTARKGAIDMSECVPCKPGSFSSGMDGCQFCPSGRFAESAAQTACEPCSAGKATVQQGSTDCLHTSAYFISCFSLLVFVFSPLAILGTHLRRSLQIDDIGMEGDTLVITVAGQHRIPSGSFNVPIVLFETRHPSLIGHFKVRALSSKRLCLLEANSQPKERCDSSSGYMSLVFPWDLHRTIICLPAWCLVLVFVALAVVYLATMEFAEGHVLLIIGLAVVLAGISVVGIRLLPRGHGPLENQILSFKELVLSKHDGLQQETSPQRSPSYHRRRKVDKGAERALSLGQLKDFYNFFLSRIRDRDMYYVSAHIIENITKETRLSYAEIVGPFNIDWFVSHYWGDTFANLMYAIEEHANDDQYWDTSDPPPRSRAYWICSFSNNQWNIEEELGSHWSEAPFYLALQSTTCRGTLMVVDDAVKPLSRSWCLFELVQTFEMTRGRDRANTHSLGSQGTDFYGLVFSTASGVINSGTAPIGTAMALAQRLATIDLADATASRDLDKTMIDEYIRSLGGFSVMNDFIREEAREALIRCHEQFESKFESLLEGCPSKSQSKSSLPSLVFL